MQQRPGGRVAKGRPEVIPRRVLQVPANAFPIQPVRCRPLGGADLIEAAAHDRGSLDGKIESTTAFGVGRRENHDSSAFYARFTPPTLSDDDTVASLDFDDAGIDDGWFVGEIADAAYRYEREVNAGERIVVGVNAFTEGDDPERRRLLRIGQDTEDLQRKRLATVRQDRDDAAVAATLARVATDAAQPTVNLMPALVDAVRARATVGEVVDTLEAEFGTYVERAVV